MVAFSDSHRNYSALQRVVEAQPQAEVFLFLGDGTQEFEDLQSLYPDKLMRAVQGNCDWGSGAKNFDVITCGGKVIFFTHGHSYGVKGGLDTLVAAARKLDADIALYGHTHVGYRVYLDGLYVMNPGSVAEPRDGGRASYGIIDITPAGIVTNILHVPKGRR